ncbi:hypothetical protein CP533_4207 [Ophiocordyceps camponoti-saundersi (nom. inval.)]|nr:hypothetical protein CP533_4207 [Ophiocordyceps camponoti-saundersi (nom. inval.)]
MSSTPLRRAAPLVFPARGKHTATVFFLHGLGDSGAGWAHAVQFWQQDRRLNEIKFILPNAPIRPITLNGGMPMPGWFDMAGLYPGPNSNYRQVCGDAAGTRESIEYVQSLIKDEVAAGIPSDRIVIGGFSQGGAIGLGAAVMASSKLAGAISLSSVGKEGCPDENLIRNNDINKAMPIFVGHGDEDTVICIEGGKATESFLKSSGYTRVTFKTYSGLAHSASMEELKDVASFLAETLPRKEQ